MTEIVVLTVILKVSPAQIHLHYGKFADAQRAMDRLVGPPLTEDSGDRSNAIEITDDHGHELSVFVDQIAAVLVTDVGQQNDVQGELALMNARTQKKFENRARQETGLVVGLPASQIPRFNG